MEQKLHFSSYKIVKAYVLNNFSYLHHPKNKDLYFFLLQIIW